jgi:arabinose-5-phosphate isomerase
MNDQALLSHRPAFKANSKSIREAVSAALKEEARALDGCAQALPVETELLVQKIVQCTGNLIFCGLGKSGLIARKLAATFSSLNFPSFFLHPVEALHGDLGMVRDNDLLIAFSKSGNGAELETIAHVCVQRSIFSVLLCCSRGTLGHLFSCLIQLPFTREACHLGLAPTSSSTLMLAYGDALAIAAAQLKQVGVDDFARNHPSGTLGKSLLLTVASLMHKDASIPFVSSHDSFQTVLYVMTSKKLGHCIVADSAHRLLGVITDGDLRRACEASGQDVFLKTAGQIMTPGAKTISSDVLAHDALELMKQSQITSLVVLSGDRVVGLVHIHDIIKAGIAQ